MEKKNNNGIVIILMGIIIIILSVLCVLFATDKLVFKSENDASVNTEKQNSDSEESKTEEEKKDYSNFIGTWRNDQTQNEITIKNVTDNEITFTWFLYRLAGIDDDTTISFKNGKGIFFYQGYDDKNFDEKQTEDEKYIRKATIELTDNGVNVIVEDVNQIDTNYKLLDNFSGSVYVKAGTYTHTNKYK